MLGVLLATLLNHALAVLVGSYLGNVLPMNLISIVAAISFLVFGLWTIRGDSIDGAKTKVGRFGPILTVGIAFFLAEMGDKTQLMTITMAAEYRTPIWVLMGTTTGMLIADGIGVLCGAWICTHVPQVYMKWAAALVFMFFGSLTLYNQVPGFLRSPLYIAPYLLVLGGLIYLVGVRLVTGKQPCDSVPTLEDEEPQHVASTPRIAQPR
jgi:putative Ca2+/H+ antiporter (TMEM165/GDT1 family)